METPRLGCVYVLLGLFLALVFTSVLHKLADLHPAGGWIGAGAVVFLLLGWLGWSSREYIAFSLRSLLVAILTLQVPLALLFRADGDRDWHFVGILALMVWFGFVTTYAVDQGLARWVRRKSLDRLELEEHKKNPRQ